MQSQIHLDYSVLRKYSTEIESLARLRESKNEPLTNVQTILYTPFKTNEEFQQFEKEYGQLLKRFDLELHKDNLIYFGGALFKAFEDAYWQQEAFKDALRALKTVAKLLRIQEKSPMGRIEINIKGIETSDNVTFDSPILIQALLPDMVKNIIKRINTVAFNPELYELLKNVKPCYEEYSQIVNSIKFKKKDQYKTTLASYSYNLLNYLNSETEFRAQVGTNVSNEQGRFLYHYLELLGFINPSYDVDKHIESDPEDYIRSLVSKHF